MKYINISILFIVVGMIIAISGCQTDSTEILESNTDEIENLKEDLSEIKDMLRQELTEPVTEEKPSNGSLATDKSEDTPKPTSPPQEETIALVKNITGNELVGVTGAFLPASGFLINENGLLLTSTIINKATTAVTVLDSNARSTGGDVIGFSEFSNIAVIQTTGENTYEYLELSTETFFPEGTKVRAVRSQCESCPAGYQTQLETTIVSSSNENNIYTLQLNTSLDSSFEGGPVLDSDNKVIGVITDPLGGTVSTIVGAGIDKMSLGSKIYQPTKPEDLENFSQATTPPFPSFYSGAASINGIPVSDVTLIYARVENYISEAVVTSNDKYSFLIIGPPTDRGFLNEKVVFYIDGFIAEQTSIYQTSMDDPLTKLDLSATVANYP